MNRGAVPPGTDPIDALREECAAVSDIVKGLDDPDFAGLNAVPGVETSSNSSGICIATSIGSTRHSTASHRALRRMTR